MSLSIGKRVDGNRPKREKIAREKFLAKLDEQVIKWVEQLKREQNEKQEKNDKTDSPF